MNLSDEERAIATEMMGYHLAAETIAGLLLRRRTLASHSEKAMLWPNFKLLLTDVIKFREIEKRRHVETDPVRAARREDRTRW